MADLTRTVAIIFEGDDKVTVATDKIVRTFEAVGTEAEQASQDVGKLDQSLEGVSKQAPGISSAADALKILAGSLVVKDFIDANLAFEQFSKTITVATGDASRVAAEYEYVRDVTNRLGISTRETADAYAKFASATKGTALEGDGARVIFEAFAGTMSRVGASSSDVAGAFVQLQQGISKGKFELDDLKSIAERIPGFFGQFAESLGVTSEELFGLVSAGKIGSEEILKFANTLNANLADATFEGYANSFARLRNAIDDTYLILGNAGAFDVLVKGLQLGTAAVVGAISFFTLLGEVVGAYYAKIALGSDFDFGAAVEASLDKAANATRGANDALLEVESTTKDIGFNAVETGQRLVDGLAAGSKGADDLAKATAGVNAALKELGVDPKKVQAGLADIEKAFSDLVKAAGPEQGAQIIAGLEGAIKRIKDSEGIAAIAADVVTAYAQGKLTSDQFTTATKLLDDAQSKLAGTLPETAKQAEDQAKSLERQAKETRKAEEAARDFALEMEKLASNERIANIEARVSLNIAELEANTQRVIASFESINTTIGSTENLISDILGLLADYDSLNYAAIRILEEQLDLENQRRQEALDMQKALTEAQIDQLRAQTQSLERGDSIIKVDGAGLQPHLEAFMWEILRTIQVRVNQDGLKLLLGV
jgi:tape measure domain-containing protein